MRQRTGRPGASDDDEERKVRRIGANGGNDERGRNPPSREGPSSDQRRRYRKDPTRIAAMPSSPASGSA